MTYSILYMPHDDLTGLMDPSPVLPCQRSCPMSNILIGVQIFVFAQASVLTVSHEPTEKTPFPLQSAIDRAVPNDTIQLTSGVVRNAQGREVTAAIFYIGRA